MIAGSNRAALLRLNQRKLAVGFNVDSTPEVSGNEAFADINKRIKDFDELVVLSCISIVSKDKPPNHCFPLALKIIALG